MGSACMIIALCLCAGGCGDQVEVTTGAELTAFEAAGWSAPELDTDRLARAASWGPYRIGPGDVLEVSLPATLDEQPEGLAPSGERQTRTCRVSDRGTITLRLPGQVAVDGMALGQAEAAIADAYYPQYSVQRPAIHVRVTEPRLYRATVLGAVARPGVYRLSRDAMSVVQLLMQAGGIVEDGAAYVKIVRAECTHMGPTPLPQPPEASARLSREYPRQSQAQSVDRIDEDRLRLSFVPREHGGTVGHLTVRLDDRILLNRQIDLTSPSARQSATESLQRQTNSVAIGEDIERRLEDLAICLNDESVGSGQTPPRFQAPNNETVILPIAGSNIPFSDMALDPGDTVIVEPLAPPLFTVLGLVQSPGNFAYAPTAAYTLSQAIGFAGGLDRTAEPRYASIYRRTKNGGIVRAVLPVDPRVEPGAAETMTTFIKPGDIAIVEHTPRTRRNVILDRIFRINFGLYAPLDGFDDD